MVNIDWEEYKKFKVEFDNPQNLDNFGILLRFVKGYYNARNILEMYDILNNDELSQMMLEKREISSPEKLESYIKKRL